MKTYHLLFIIGLIATISTQAMDNFDKKHSTDDIQAITDLALQDEPDQEKFCSSINQILNNRLATIKKHNKTQWPAFLSQNPSSKANDLAEYHLLGRNSEELAHIIAEKAIPNQLRPDIFALWNPSAQQTFLTNNQEAISSIKNSMANDLLYNYPGICLPGKEPHLVINKDLFWLFLCKKKFMPYLYDSTIHHEFTHVMQEQDINTINNCGKQLIENNDSEDFKQFLSQQGSMLSSIFPEYLDRYREDEQGSPYFSEINEKPAFTKKSPTYLDEAEACIEEGRWVQNPYIHAKLQKILPTAFTYNYPSRKTVRAIQKKWNKEFYTKNPDLFTQHKQEWKKISEKSKSNECSDFETFLFKTL